MRVSMVYQSLPSRRMLHKTAAAVQFNYWSSLLTRMTARKFWKICKIYSYTPPKLLLKRAARARAWLRLKKKRGLQWRVTSHACTSEGLQTNIRGLSLLFVREDDEKSSFFHFCEHDTKDRRHLVIGVQCASYTSEWRREECELKNGPHEYNSNDATFSNNERADRIW